MHLDLFFAKNKNLSDIYKIYKIYKLKHFNMQNIHFYGKINFNQIFKSIHSSINFWENWNWKEINIKNLNKNVDFKENKQQNRWLFFFFLLFKEKNKS